MVSGPALMFWVAASVVALVLILALPWAAPLIPLAVLGVPYEVRQFRVRRQMRAELRQVMEGSR